MAKNDVGQRAAQAAQKMAKTGQKAKAAAPVAQKAAGRVFNKHKKYGHVYCGYIQTPAARVAWPFLTKPKAPREAEDDNGNPRKPRYEVTLVLEKGKKSTAKFLAEMEKIADTGLELFNKGKKKGKLSIEEVIPDGDEFKADFLEKNPYYEGALVLTARNEAQPAVWVKDGDTNRKAKPSEISAGMVVTCVLTPIISATGLSYRLELVSLVEDDDTRWSSASRPSAAKFAGIAEEDLEDEEESNESEEEESNESEEEESDKDTESEDAADDEEVDEEDDDEEVDEEDDDDEEEDDEEEEAP